MIDLSPHLRAVGAAFLVIAFMHAGFPRRFEWSRELAGLSLLNRQMMGVHTFFVALSVGLMGLLCLAGTRGLIEPSALGRWIAAGLAVFWAVRLYCQFFVYDPALWRGKPFETIMHLLFGLFWAYATTVFSALLWRQLQS